MPQLVERGKYVFGWTRVNRRYGIRIPDEAYDEYEFFRTDKVILVPGSKSSGGFGISTPDSMLNSEFRDHILNAIGYDKATGVFKANKLEIVPLGKRFISWTNLDKERYLHLSETFLGRFDVKAEARLLVIRGSGIGPAFITKGMIYREALRHKNILEFHS